MHQHRINRADALGFMAGSLLAATRPALAQNVATKVRMGAQPMDATGEAFYGADAGIFQANGITPQVTLLNNGATILEAVIAGELDAGQANTMSVASAIAGGLPLQVLAPSVLYSKRDANANLVVAKNAPYKTPKDLIGATFGVGSINDFNHISLLVWLDANGVPAKSVKFVELPFGEVGPALIQGRVQASFITEPFKTAAIAAHQIRDFGDTYLAVGPEIAVVVWFATKKFVGYNPDAVKKLTAGIYATARWANAHNAESAPMLARASKIDPSVVATMKRLYFAMRPDKRYLESILAVAAKYGGLSRPVSYEEFVGLAPAP
jgi:NitT/TauT family transport system substrate-binding protein